MHKRLISRSGVLLFWLWLLFGVVACSTQPGSNTDASTAPTDSGATDTLSSTPMATTGTTGEEVVATNSESNGYNLNPDVSGNVEFWHFWGSPARRTAIQRVVALCQQELPNIQVTEVFKPFGDIWTANTAAVAAGTGMPDVIVEDRPQLPQRARDQIATNLQPYIERDGFDGSQYLEFAWDETLYEGNSYGIPFETDVRVLFYNKNAFREAGLDPEQPPTTWDEVVEYADALDIQEGNNWQRIGFMPLWRIGADFWAYTNGWEAIQEGRPAINDPALVEAIEWVKTRVDHYGGWENVRNFEASYGSPPNDLFMSGAVPMIVEVSSYASQLNFYRPRTESGEEIEWGMAIIPYNTEPSNWSGGFAFSIPQGADAPDAAWEFIKCAAGPIGQGSWARDVVAVPTNLQTLEDPQVTVMTGWETIRTALDQSQGSQYVTAYPQWSQELGPRFERVWLGELSPTQMVEEAQAAIDAVMADNE